MSFLTKNTLVYILVAALGLCLLFTQYQFKRLDSLKSQNSQLKADIAVLGWQIQRCNAATDLLKKKTDALILQKQKAQEAAQEAIRKGQKESSRVKRSFVPSECPQAIVWGLKQIPGIITGWEVR